MLMLRCHLARRWGFFFFGGGPRGTRQRGWKLAISFISPPQHGYLSGAGAGLGGGRASAPSSSGRPVWKAMR